MNKFQLIIVFVMVIIGVGGLAYVISRRFSGGSGQNEIRGLMGARNDTSHRGGVRAGRPDPMDLDIDELKKQLTKGGFKSKQEDISTQLFRGGFFTAADRRWFFRFRIICLVVAVITVPLTISFVSSQPSMVITGGLLGVLIGFSWPMSWLQRQIRKREEDILYFLPLVIEQVSIGVSSALDVGPCISQIVSMADERDSHNPVTEMFVHVEKLMRSGLNLEDSLAEVAEANGMSEVKHAFMFLAQCARHGGEVSKQLQELADSVMVQRQVQIEGKITALPVKATGPLAMVFAGFFGLLFAGLLVNLLGAFGK